MGKLLVAIFSYLICIAAEAAEFFVAPDGTPEGTGAESAPWDLQTALNHPSAIQPGDTIWLRGGVYSTTAENFFISTLNGSQSQPIVVRAYLGERATIDGRMDISSNDTWYWNLEFTIFDPPPPVDLTRTEQDEGYADNVYRHSNLEIRGNARNRVINSIFHENHIGVSMSTGATDLEFYGNIVYHNGRLASDLPSGHGMYVQNEGVLGHKRIADNIIANNFLNGLNLYSAGVSFVQNIEVTGNIAFSNGIEGVPLYGSNLYAEAPNPIQDLHILGNLFYTPYPVSGIYLDIANAFLRGVGSEQNIIIDNNIFTNGGILLLFLDQFQLTNNRFGPQGEVQLRWPQDINRPFDITIDNNTYSNINFNPWFFDNGVYDQVNTGTTNEGFIQWRKILQDNGITGADAASTNSETSPQDLIVFLRPNEYESGRANLAILDFGDQQEITVDVSAVLPEEASFSLQYSHDFFGTPALIGEVNNAQIIVPRSLLGKAPNTDEDFGAFVLLNMSDSDGDGVPDHLDIPITKPATFSGTTLTIPVVAAEDEFYSVELTLINEQTLEFQLASGELLTSASPIGQSVFADNKLNIPKVVVGSTSYIVELTLTNSSPIIFTLTEFGEL